MEEGREKRKESELRGLEALTFVRHVVKVTMINIYAVYDKHHYPDGDTAIRRLKK